MSLSLVPHHNVHNPSFLSPTFCGYDFSTYTTQQCLSILSLWFLSIELEDGNFELTRLSHVKVQMGKAELSHPLVVFITTNTFAVHSLLLVLFQEMPQ
jgi:hypothetical protein